jgi:thiosulfate/3-mercaptopyruvate sulfurtransferase
VTIEPVIDIQGVRDLTRPVVLADVRFYLDGRSGREAYGKGHLPGAIFVGMHDLAAPATAEDGRHPLPDPADFAGRMGALGIGDDDVVIAYDDAGGVMAARLVWMLRATGHDAALLDGGLTAYEGQLETDITEKSEKTFPVRPWPADRLATLTDATSGNYVVIDARQPERFRGETEPIDSRPGHIPGARSIPCRENIDKSDRFLAPDELRARFEAAGIQDGTDVVSYCGSGVTACHNLLAMEHAGFAPGRLYPGSWSQYSNTDLPAAVGD